MAERLATFWAFSVLACVSAITSILPLDAACRGRCVRSRPGSEERR
jgi:hypothetical protein